MKMLTILCLLLTINLVSAQAPVNYSKYNYDNENSVPLLAKFNSAGFTRAEYRRSSKCELYLNKVVVTRSLGNITTVKKIDLEVSKSIIDAINSAKLEKEIKEDNWLCDAPGTSIITNPNERELTHTLYTSGGCGSPKITKDGVFSRNLISIIDEYCPLTR